jgi:hypothetical protein
MDPQIVRLAMLYIASVGLHQMTAGIAATRHFIEDLFYVPIGVHSSGREYSRGAVWVDLMLGGQEMRLFDIS